MVEQTVDCCVICPADLELLRAKNILSNFSKNLSFQEINTYPELVATVPGIAYSLQAAIDLPPSDNERFVIPVLDGTYDVDEIIAAQVPVSFVAVDNKGDHLVVTGVTQSDDVLSCDYEVIVPFEMSVGVPAKRSDIDMKAIKYVGDEQTTIEPQITEDPADVKKYLDLLKRGIDGILTGSANDYLVDEFSRRVRIDADATEEEGYHDPFSDDWSETWGDVFQFAYRHIAGIPISELGKVVSHAGQDMVDMLVYCDRYPECGSRKPMLLESGNDRSKIGSPMLPGGEIKRIMVYRSDEKLSIVGGIQGVEGETVTEYELHLPFEGLNETYQAVDCKSGRTYLLDEQTTDDEEAQGYLHIAQTAAKDMLTAVPLPHQVRSY